MPKTPINFSNTVIYNICCKDVTITDIYVGHTTDIISRRHSHKNCCNNDKGKKYNLKQYQFIRNNGGWNNWDLIEIEQYPCENVNEARARERYWIEELKPSLNSYIPNRTASEYYKDEKEKVATKQKIYYEENKQEILEYQKQYAAENKEKVAEYRKQYAAKNKEEIARKTKIYRKEHKDEINTRGKEKIRCDICDCDVPRRHISVHNKTLKHLSKLKLEDGDH
jgi:hypothetical protein